MARHQSDICVRRANSTSHQIVQEHGCFEGRSRLVSVLGREEAAEAGAPRAVAGRPHPIRVRDVIVGAVGGSVAVATEANDSTGQETKDHDGERHPEAWSEVRVL